MTNMEQIAYIAAQERLLGKSYGHGVAERGRDYAKLESTPMPIMRRCTRCGREYLPPIGKIGKPYKSNICPDCRGKPAIVRKPRTKVYIRQCTICGAEVETTQAPRAGCNLYCPDCKRDYARCAEARSRYNA